MTIATHTAIGAAIGFSIGNPIFGFLLSFVSHLIIDMIPHGDCNMSTQLRVQKKKKVPIMYGTIDALFAMFLALFIFNLDATVSNISLSAAIAGSVLPDLLIGLHDVTKSKYLRWFKDLHFFFHDFFPRHFRDVKLTYSIIAQIFIIAVIVNML